MEYINGSELAEKRFIKLENSDLRDVQTGGKFIPQCGETYYYLRTNGSISDYESNDDSIDRWILKHHHVFRTRKECEVYRHFLKVLDEYTFEPDWNDPKQKKWAPSFSHSAHKIFLLSANTLQYSGAYFESKEKGEAFFSKVGEEAVKHYMFDIWE